MGFADICRGVIGGLWGEEFWVAGCDYAVERSSCRFGPGG